MSRDLTAPTMTVDHELRAKRPTFPSLNDPRTWVDQPPADMRAESLAEDGYYRRPKTTTTGGVR